MFNFSSLPIGRTITLEMVSNLGIASGDVVLIYTGYAAPQTATGWPEAVALTYQAAVYLAAIPVRAFGTDAFNVESMTDQTPVAAATELARAIPGHYAFRSRGIPIYEHRERMYFVGEPLNIEHADGMLVRPVALVY